MTSGGRTIFRLPFNRNGLLLKGTPLKFGLNLVAVTVNTIQASNPIGSTSSVVSAGYPNYNALDDQIIPLYRQYLKRMPTNAELAALHLSPNLAGRVSTLPIEMMAAQEYFDAAGNPHRLWLQKVLTERFLGRTPTQPEFDQWIPNSSRTFRYSRTELLRQLYAQNFTRPKISKALRHGVKNIEDKK